VRGAAHAQLGSAAGLDAANAAKAGLQYVFQLYLVFFSQRVQNEGCLLPFISIFTKFALGSQPICMIFFSKVYRAVVRFWLVVDLILIP
jgi:hypothetical protein